MGPQSQSTEPGSAALPALVYFAKVPQPGQVKTRLCPPLLPEEAAALYGSFLSTGLRALPGLDCYCYGWPAAELAALRPYLPAGMALLPQRGPDLFARMQACFKERLSAGHPAVLLRNTDSPDLPDEIVAAAAAACRPGRLVLGPDQGGGYYLVGLCELPEGLFADLDEGAETVFAATVARAAQLGLEVYRLPEWPDVDSFEDLLALWRRRG